MAWIKRTKKKDGTVSFWVHDIRNGRIVTIKECPTKPEASLHKEQYEIRRDLEKDGYDDRFAEKIADELFGKRIKETGNGLG